MAFPEFFLQFCLIVASAVTCDATQQLVTGYPVASSGSDGAFIDCPCKRDTGISSADLGWDAPKDYGSSCKAWHLEENGWPLCQVAIKPSYCSQRWCYIDTAMCNRSFTASGAPEGMHISYQTCGSIDLLNETLSSETQQAVIEPPGGFYNGLIYNGLGRWHKNEGSNYEREIVKYSRELLHSMGLNPDMIKHRILSNESRELCPNSNYTALVRDIALGHAHIGMYAFWQTAERINFGASPLPFYQDDFCFWTPKNFEKEHSFWELAMRPFEPFRWDLWLLIIGTVVFAALNLACVEFGISSVLRNPFCIIRVIEDAFLSLFSGSLVERYQRPAARVLAMGFSVFIVIVIASFTGSTTSFLVGRSKPKISTLRVALKNREPICVYNVVNTALVEMYPELSEIGVPVEWKANSDIFQYLQNGSCKHAIAPLSEQDDPSSCSFARVGDPLFSIPIGPFVQEEFVTEFNYHHAQLRERGVWGTHAALMAPQYPCPDDDLDGGEMQLTAEHMFGVCGLMFMCSIVSMMLHLFQVGEKKISEELERSDHESLQNIAEALQKIKSLDDKLAASGGRLADFWSEGEKEVIADAERVQQTTRDLASRIDQIEVVMQKQVEKKITIL